MFSYGIALYCQMRNLAKTQIRIYKMSLKFLGDIFVFIRQPKGSGGGKTCVHHETRLLACVKTADLLTTAQFSGMMCVENVLLRTSPWYLPQLGRVTRLWINNKGDLLRRPPLKYIQSDITSWEWIRHPGCQDCRTFCSRSPGYLQESYSWWYPRNLSGHCCLYHRYNM